MNRLAVLTLALAALVPGSRFPVPGSGFWVQGSGFWVQGSLTARFHHVHYRVADPSAAMGQAVAQLGGTREVVSGLGVGVRTTEGFLLFDRVDEAATADVAQQSLAAAYDQAVTWLRGKGIAVEGGGLGRIRDAGVARYHHLAFATTAFEAAVARAGTPLDRRPESAIFDGAGVLIEIVRDTDVPDIFWCPMHPDVRAGTAGKCPLCGMDFVPIPPPKVGEYKLDVVLQRTRSGARGMKLTVRDPDTNAVVDRFETVHEKTFHLFLVSRDLAYFAHVHPEAQLDGTFVLKHPFPRGEYMLFADFLPVGGTSQMVQRAILVGVRSQLSQPAGVRSQLSTPPGRDNRDLTPGETVVDGLRVALRVEDMVAGKDACLTFTVTDAKTGVPVTDLQPFLGAPAHMLMVRSDLTDAVHAHPEELKTGGPTVSFHPLIPAAGDYKLWIQFQRGGRVTTAAFTLRAD